MPIPTAHAVSGNRKYAAALQALRKCLRQQLEALCKALEDNMEDAVDVSAATMLSRFSYLPADLPNLQLQLCRTPSTRQKAARVSSTLLAVLP